MCVCVRIHRFTFVQLLKIIVPNSPKHARVTDSWTQRQALNNKILSKRVEPKTKDKNLKKKKQTEMK